MLADPEQMITCDGESENDDCAIAKFLPMTSTKFGWVLNEGARKRIKGWLFKDDKHYCPRCRDKYKREGAEK